MEKVKIIAMYLPQFHSIPENNKFWGEGFTDWVTLKNAKPLFDGHQQPVVPFQKNYYDLSEEKNVVWQCKLAEKYGIYGFGVYHYWFNDNQNLLVKPAEIMRDCEEINTKYFFTWDNCSWVRSWSNVSGNDWSPLEDSKQNKKGPKILVEYKLGQEKNWLNHYNYLKSHFKSKNYMKHENKPVFAIINYNEDILRMCEYWDTLAKADGFEGITFFFKYKPFIKYPESINLYNYEPHFSGWVNVSYLKRIQNAIIRKLKLEKDIYIYDYDKVWKSLIKNAAIHKESNFFHGAFIGYDDSPRRGRKRSRIIVGGTPQKFSKYLKEIIQISEEQKKDYVFLTAWNEWSEGAYLEPDETHKFGYLEALKETTKSIR